MTHADTDIAPMGLLIWGGRLVALAAACSGLLGRPKHASPVGDPETRLPPSVASAADLLAEGAVALLLVETRPGPSVVLMWLGDEHSVETLPNPGCPPSPDVRR